MSKTKQEVNTSLQTVRREAAETIIGLKNGSISPLVSDAIYKQAITIIDSYRVELRAIELATRTQPGVDYKKATALIAKQD